MAFGTPSVTAHTSSAANPNSFTFDVLPGERLVVLMLKVASATSRAGGSPTMALSGGLSYTFLQANSTQKAAASPEASAEIWYVLNPVPGSYTCTIPNTGALTIFRRLAISQCGGAKFDQANGGNGTSTNPTPGAITPTEDGAIAFAVVATGAQTWAPSARGGTLISDHDDGANGTGYQYTIQTTKAAVTLNWTFATSDDWGAVVASFTEIPGNRLINYQRPSSQGLSIGGIG